MTITEFINRYQNRPSRQFSTSVSKPQCVCLIKYYLREVFGIADATARAISGDAKDYYNNGASYACLKNNFTQVKYSSTNKFVPKKGDIVIWGADVTSSHNYGHVAIALGTGDSSNFYTLDQNWGSTDCIQVKHSYTGLIGVLRPKTTGTARVNKFPTAVTWKNGSSSETAYKNCKVTTSVGSLDANESAKCYGKTGLGTIVVYTVNSTGKHKAGYVKYRGGVNAEPLDYKTYKNNSSTQTVYADTGKATTVGSLDPNETCECLGKIDNMYLVQYKVNGSTDFKIGFVTYSGGC